MYVQLVTKFFIQKEVGKAKKEGLGSRTVQKYHKYHKYHKCL
jgi:hypothetical protein